MLVDEFNIKQLFLEAEIALNGLDEYSLKFKF